MKDNIVLLTDGEVSPQVKNLIGNRNILVHDK